MNLTELFSTQFIFLSLAIGIIVYLIRLSIEAKFPKVLLSKHWTDLCLPTISIIVGSQLSLISSLAPSWMVGASHIDRALYGILAGFCSSYVFRAAKNFLIKESGGS